MGYWSIKVGQAMSTLGSMQLQLLRACLFSHWYSKQAPPDFSCGCTLTVSTQQIAGDPHCQGPLKRAPRKSWLTEFACGAQDLWNRWPNPHSSLWFSRLFVCTPLSSFATYLPIFAADGAALLVTGHLIDGLSTEWGRKRRMGALIQIYAIRRVSASAFIGIIKDLFLVNSNFCIAVQNQNVLKAFLYPKANWGAEAQRVVELRRSRIKLAQATWCYHQMDTISLFIFWFIYWYQGSFAYCLSNKDENKQQK